MRLAPIPMFFARQPAIAIQYSGDSSRTTHASRQAVDACRYFGAVILGALSGATIDELLSSPAGWSFVNAEAKELLGQLDPAIQEVAEGSFKSKMPPYIQGSGYVVRGMEAALWAFYQSNTFKQGALLAANLGDDADTTAAVYGQLAGAYYGELGIPSGWRKKLAKAGLITSYADKLWGIIEKDRQAIQ